MKPIDFVAIYMGSMSLHYHHHKRQVCTQHGIRPALEPLIAGGLYNGKQKHNRFVGVSNISGYTEEDALNDWEV